MRRGEIWLINLDPTIGAEIKKVRPAVIVSDNAIGILPLKVIVPIWLPDSFIPDSHCEGAERPKQSPTRPLEIASPPSGARNDASGKVFPGVRAKCQVASVPITDWKDHYTIAPWMVCIQPDTVNGLAKLSAADAFQVRSVAQERFVRPLGRLSDRAMQEIGRALAIVLCIEP